MPPATNDPGNSVERLLESLRQGYLAEFPERCDDLETTVMELGKSDRYKNAFESTYRNVHSIKGSAGTHGLMALSSICHHFEDLLSKIDQEGGTIDDEQMDVCLKYIDLLRDSAAQLQNGIHDDEVLNTALAENSKRVFPSEHTGLLVDSSKFNAKVIKNALTELPVKLTIVMNGYEALERLLHEKFDFMITVKELPVLNGVALLSAIRASETTNAGIKAVLVTSKDDVTLPFPGLVDHIIKKDQSMSSALRDAVREIL